MCIRDRAKAQSILFETFSRAEQPMAQAIFGIGVISVSYTHLDVYKRQGPSRSLRTTVETPFSR